MPSASSPVMDQPVETVASFLHVYSSPALEAQQERISRLTSSFQSHFGHAPTFIARPPGRANLIGEHIDYSGYSVLPLALADRDFLIATSVSERPPTDPVLILVYSMRLYV